MSPAPDTRPPLDPTVLRDLPAPFHVEVRETSPSTSSAVADLARGGESEGLVLVAEHQTEGRGRLDRRWETPARASLTFSVLLRPRVAPQRWPVLALLTGLAVVDGVAAAGGPPVMLKWPNDVLALDGLKVAGLLLERVDTADGPAAVVGVGLNVSAARTELPVPTAGSLVTAGMVGPDRSVVLRRVIEALVARYDAWQAERSDDSLLAAYAERCDTLGREVLVNLPGDRTLRGQAVGLDPHGALVVRDSAGRHTVHAGDVIHVRVP